MEFFSAYSVAQDLLDGFFSKQFEYQSSLTFLLWALGIGIILFLPFFILQGIGMYTMAKRQGLNRKWMAFVPFVNILFLGKIAGECKFFNRKMKNAGAYALIAQILTTLATGFLYASSFYLLSVYGEPTEMIEVVYGMEFSYYTWPEATKGLGKVACWYYEHGSDFTVIFDLIYVILMFVLVIATLKKYTPRHHSVLSLITLLVPLSRSIILFVLRNKEPIDYDAMMRARREAYMRQQQQYRQQYGSSYGSPYGNPYGNPYGGYGAPNGNPYGAPNQASPQNQPAPEEPFEEFSSAETTSNVENNGEGDSFFD